jgi:glycogen synthase
MSKRNPGKISVAQIGPMPPPSGGVAVNMLAIHKALLAAGHRSLIIDVTDRNGAKPEPFVLKPRSAAGLFRTLAGLDCDIVHYHAGGNFSPKLAMLTLLCGVLPGKRSVLTFHSGGYARDALVGAKPFSLRGVALRSIDLVIGVNEGMLDLFRAYGVPEESMRLIIPAETPAFDPEHRLPMSLEEGIGGLDPLLLSVGGLEREYNHDQLIRSLPVIQERYPNAGLAIAGTGGLERDLKSLVNDLGLHDRVIFLDDVDHRDLMHIMRRSTVMFRLTDFDGDSISVREALSLGTPVVASDNAKRPKAVLTVKLPLDAQALLKSVDKAKNGQFAYPADDGPGRSGAAEVLEAYIKLLDQ